MRGINRSSKSGGEKKRRKKKRSRYKVSQKTGTRFTGLTLMLLKNRRVLFRANNLLMTLPIPFVCDAVMH